MFLGDLRSVFHGNGILGKMGGREGLLPVSLLLTGFLVIQGRIVKLGIAADWLVYCAVRIVICIVQAVPIEMCQRGARAVAWLANDILRVRHKVVDDNLRHAFAELSAVERKRLSRQMWEHLLLMVCEIAHVPRAIHSTNWRSHVRLVGIEPEMRCLLSERPAILLSAHFGNFEVGGYLCGLFGFPTYTVVRPLDNVFLDRFVRQFRGTHGQHILPKNDVATQIADLLGEGENLAILGDQFGGAKGCWVEFFGRPASYHKAIALFSLTTDAPLLVTYAKRLSRPLMFEIGVLGVFDPREIEDGRTGVAQVTQWYSDLLEQAIRNDPAQYWWLHRRWKDPRKPRSGKKNRADGAHAEMVASGSGQEVSSGSVMAADKQVSNK